MEIKKYILVPNSDWKLLKNGVTQERKISMPRLPVKELAKKYNAQCGIQEARPRSRPNSKTIQDFISRAKKVVSKEKILPVNLKRAMLLSDIFTEKRNQLKFQKALKKVNKELLDEENRAINVDVKNFQTEQYKKKLQQQTNKVVLGKRLKNEILELNLKKRREKLDEVNQQREEISNINRELEKEAKQAKFLVIETKQQVDKMHRDDLQTKMKELQTSKILDKEEFKIFDAQLKFIHQIDDIRKNIDKVVNVRKPPVIEPSEILPKEVIRRYCDLPVIKKSKLEEKRDLYTKRLKQQRIQGQELEVQETVKCKTLISKERETEYQRRCDNVKVTKLFEQLKRRRLLGRIKEYRKIWNTQCDEKRVTGEKCKQEDVTRRENLLQKIRQEDDEYTINVKAILNEYQKKNKIINPIVKCLKEGYS